MPDRIQSVFQKRTHNARFSFENPANPSNMGACLRTLDSFGTQHVDVWSFNPGNTRARRLFLKNLVCGSDKSLTVRNHLTTQHALETVRDEYHIVCTDVLGRSNKMFKKPNSSRKPWGVKSQKKGNANDTRNE
jgi:hypothetical protein